MTHSPTPTELLALRTANAALLNSPDSFCDMVATVVFALGSAQLLQSPETAAEWKRERDSLAAQADRVIRAEQRRAELEAVLGTHRKDDEAEIGRLRDRVAELEAAAYGDAPVRLLEPVAQIGHLRSALAAQMHRADTLNWICKEQRQRADTAEARVAELEAERAQVAALLPTEPCIEQGLPNELDAAEAEYGAWELVAGALGVPIPRPLEDPHDSPLHHSYAKARQLEDQ